MSFKEAKVDFFKGPFTLEKKVNMEASETAQQLRAHSL